MILIPGIWGRDLRIAGATVEKSWQWEHLLDYASQLEKRIESISRLSNLITSIPVTFFRRVVTHRHTDHGAEQNLLVQSQTRIRPFYRFGAIFNSATLGKLAEDLDRISATGLVHGDICPGNLCSDADRYYLIDWEPSFWQIKKEKPVLMFTDPYIAPREKGVTHHLTQFSDRVAFYLSLQKAFMDIEPCVSEACRVEKMVETLSFTECLAQFQWERERCWKRTSIS